MSYLSENELFSNRQYGFIKDDQRSFSYYMFDKWTEYLKGGGQIDAIYSDFEKAFDKVPHKILISKLYSYGLHDSIINWIFEFLKARQCRVKVNISYSDWDDVTSGIPQGSVLGPLLLSAP